MHFNVVTNNDNMEEENYNDTLSIFNDSLKRRLYGKNQVATFLCHYFKSIKHARKMDILKIYKEKL